MPGSGPDGSRGEGSLEPRRCWALQRGQGSTYQLAVGQAHEARPFITRHNAE